MSTENPVPVKKTIVRSHSYPAYTIEQSIQLVKEIRSALGDTSHNTRESIAQVLKKSVDTVVIPISTAVQYGLLEMKSKIGYKPAAIFDKIRIPLSEEEKRGALLECFKSPTLYEGLINEFGGKSLPNLDGLSIILVRKYSISESASKKAAQTFLENATALGLIDHENRLVISNETQNTGIEKTEQVVDAKIERLPNERPYQERQPFILLQNEKETPHTQTVNNPDTITIEIPLRGGEFIAKLVAPKDVTSAELTKISKFIELLREE